MLFLEHQARLLLVLHLVLAGALVASATHLVVWMRGYPRGSFGRHRGVRRFGWIVASLFAANFLVGNVIYPIYKVRVRVEYLDDTRVLARDHEARSEAARARSVTVGERDDAPLTDRVDLGAGSRLAHWFDVKEHWIALGLPLALALAAILTAWDPRRDGPALAGMATGMAALVAGILWLGAIVGALVTAARSIAAPPG